MPGPALNSRDGWSGHTSGTSVALGCLAGGIWGFASQLRNVLETPQNPVL